MPKAIQIIFLLLILFMPAHISFATATAFDHHAYEVNARRQAGVPVEWFSCKTAADCTFVNPSCGPSIGIRTDHAKDAINVFCKNSHYCKTGSCDSSAIPAAGALCVKGECVADYSEKAWQQPPHE